MKMNLKRLMAVLLLVGLLSSMVVPATFADAGAAQPETVTYDFQVYKNADFASGFTYTILSNNFNGHRTYNSTMSIAQWFYNNYPNTINWGMELSGGGNSGTANQYKDFEFRGKADQGMRMYAGDGQFMSVRIYVPAAGTYNVSVTAGSTGSVADVYMFPATASYSKDTLTSKDSITTAMGEAANLVKDNAALSANGDISLGKKTFDTAGDYIVVFKAEGTFGDGIALRSLTLTPVAETEPEATTAPTVNGTDVDFKFDVVNDYAEQCGGLNKQYFINKGNTAVLDLLNSLYPDTLNWKYETSHTGDVPTIRVQSGEGLRLYGEVDGWIAFRLTGITAGKYDINITSTKGGHTVDIYLIPAADDLDISASLTAENLLKSGITQTATLAEGRDLTAGDYILVFKTTAVGGNGYFRFPLVSFNAVAEETDEETTAPENTTLPEDTTPTDPGTPGNKSFKFDVVNDYADQCGLLHKKNFKNSCDYGGSTGDYLTSLYPNVLNWKYEDCSNDDLTLIRVMQGEGVRIHGTEGYWAAFRLNDINAGTYDVTLTGTGGGNSVNVYLMKAAAGLDIASAMTEDNLIEPTMTAGEKIAAGLELTRGDYLLVIENTAIDGNGYFRLKQLDVTLADGQPETDSDVPTEPEPEEPPVPLEPDQDGDFTFDVVVNYPALCGKMNSRNYTNAATDGKGNPVYSPEGKQYRNVDYLASLYAQGYMDWVLEDCFFQNGNGVMNLEARSGQGLRIYGKAGDWAAFRLTVPAAGEYNLKITGSGRNTVSLYLVEAAEGLDISKAMTDENLLIADVVGLSAAAVQEKVKIEAKDYILIVKHIVQANTDKDFWTLNRLELEVWTEKQPIPVSDKMVYDFDMVAMDSRFLKKGFNNRLVSGGISAKAQIAEMYKEGSLHWSYENLGAGITDMTFRENAIRIRSGKNYNSVEDAFLAFRVANPGTDTFDVRLVTDGASMVCMDVYFIPLKNTMVLTPEEIKEAMTKDNLLVSNALVDKNGTFYLGEYTFGMEDEYLLVFKFTKGTAFFLSQVEMTKDGLVADGTIKYGASYKGVVYDLDLADAMNGIYPESKINMPDVIDDMNARWRAGSLNWKWVNGSDGMSGDTPATEYDPTTNLRFYRAGGMRVYAGPDSWFALKIKSPGSGDFTITLNHAVTANSGTIAMYILPADTDIDKIWEATDPENRVGKVYLGNDDGDSAIVDGSTSFVGYWNFEAGKEYILVIEGYEKSRFNSRYCYMNMSQIIMERGIISYETAAREKHVDPITVLENAVPVMETGLYGACA